MISPQLLDTISSGFASILIDDRYRITATEEIRKWLVESRFSEYQPLLLSLIERGKWDYLLDCFYQVIPFGTGGRRGEIGPGPNRINPYTIELSAQGHSQYLIKKYGNEARKRGVVFAYDVRHFYGNQYVESAYDSPLCDLDGKKLAELSSVIYAAHGIPVKMFSSPRTTPELSFAIRHLHAISGVVFSASHNPIDHNGKKIYDETGGMLTPPFDEELVNEVVYHTSEVSRVDFEGAKNQGLIQYLGEEVDHAYVAAVSEIFPSNTGNLKIYYAPLHGTGITSVYPVLQKLGYDIILDQDTSVMSGRFEHVRYQIANPELPESFANCTQKATEVGADIILNTDPDADRIGCSVYHKNSWHFLDGNQIATILVSYFIGQNVSENTHKSVVKTMITTSLMTVMCEKNALDIYPDLLVGFKYIGHIMNQLEKNIQGVSLVLGCEESHGYLTGNYARDKDAVSGAGILSTYASELKKHGKTLIDALEGIYRTYGYFKNDFTEFRMLGATGNENIVKIQNTLRLHPPKFVGQYEVMSIRDYLDDTPYLSDTDKIGKNILVWTFRGIEGIPYIKITPRPSGTEPKSKLYFEIGTDPVGDNDLAEVILKAQGIKEELEKEMTKICLDIIGIKMPERYLGVYFQVPVESKMRYFEIEDQLADLTSLPVSERRDAVLKLLKFLGSDPLLKVNKAFQMRFGKTVEAYLEI